MKKVKNVIEWLGWEAVFFLIAAIIALSLIYKVIYDFLSVPIERNVHFTITDLQNSLVALALIHGMHMIRKRHKKRVSRRTRMIRP